MIDPATRERIAQVCEAHGIGLCYLYGSQALPDDPDEMADVDLGVVPHDWPKHEGGLSGWLALQSALSPLVTPRPLDLVQLDRAGCHLQHEAVTEGTLVYCADEELRVRFEDAVVREWLDYAWVVDANYKDIRAEMLPDETRDPHGT